MIYLTDIKYAVRLIIKRPAFTLLTVVVLSGGFSISLYAFGALKTLVYGELPVTNSESIVRIGAGRWPNFAPLDAYELARLREEVDGLTGLGGYRSTRAMIGDGDSVRIARGIESDWRIFSFTGTEPLQGRGFIEADSGAG